jgi:hypothetical protein
MSESTDEKLLGNFRKLIDQCAAYPNDYKPSNPLYEIAKLEGQYAAGLAAVKDIEVKNAPLKVAVNDRKIAYDAAPKLYRRSRNNLKASGASKEFVADASGAVDKLVGRRKTPALKDNPDTPENESAASHSASQMSFESLLGHARAYNELVRNEPLYKPNESDLKTGSLDAFADDLEAKNNMVSQLYPPVGQARGLRDTLLYNDPNNIVDTALGVKSYVASLGSSHPLYKAIKGLKFPRQQK